MRDDRYITFQPFDQFEELICAFSTRRGGHSEGIFSSLNMGNIKHDDPLIVKNNRKLFFNKLGIIEEAVALPDQVHSANIKIISTPGIVPKTDALVTIEKGLFLGIQTADCFPVFIYDPEKKIVAIIHAGWRGVVQNILRKTTDLMIKSFGLLSSDLYVAIGPGLQKECFEVRADVFKHFPEEFLDMHQDTSKRYLNLSGYRKHLIISLDIPEEQIYASPDCTKCNHVQYFSYRRDRKLSGRMLGIIGLRA
ncbi:MAG: peptidoglycan editing factor PgeF [Calditrichia bacterium]|nr:peptidoglycan editing factor PgeF [Calditrichia bacterium]